MKVSGFTAISRVLGFLRDAFIAAFVGAGLVGDAFFAAFRFPNMFRRIFGEGAFNAAFVPMFGRRVADGGKPTAMQFANNAFSTLLVVLGIASLIAIPCMPWIMGKVIVPGFNPESVSEIAQEAQLVEARTKHAKQIFFSLDADKNHLEEIQLHDLTLVVEQEKSLDSLGALLRIFEPGAKGEHIVLDQSNTVIMPADGSELKLSAEQKELVKNHQLFKLTGFEYIEDQWVLTDEVANIQLASGNRVNWISSQIGATEENLGRVAELSIYRNHPDTLALTIKLSQITFCYLLFMALVAHMSGMLNTFNIFSIPAAAPILLNIVFILGLSIFVYGMKSEFPGHVLAWCVALAGVVQFALLWWACKHYACPIVISWPHFNADMKRLFGLMGPGVIAAGIQQVNLVIGTIIASFQAGAISYLYYSERVYQLPLGMIGIALGVVLLPEVTRQLRKNDREGANESILRGAEFGLIITLPAAVAMMVIPDSIISVLFQRGEFDAVSTKASAAALAGFAVGLPGYVLIKVLQPGYFAQENTKSPMKMAGVTVLVNIVVSLLLFPKFGHVGIAVATSVAAWVNVGLLVYGLRGLVKPNAAFLRRISMMLGASVLMGVVVFALRVSLISWLDGSFIERLISLSIMVAAGMASYAGFVLLLKATSIAELKSSFRR
ncbi:murein biosynthesis integral membrane protein MurJ [Persicirhabdus sediminis]|uniref:Probable lipid II flippase MurJ n=1 Tax=Persicirhabdus sediminis TaxID=454144 RepID=A0A8J7SIS1_9BACT|nr:murein biosynthesis integral membrane protein MurJ [Persicirhabdus sediminis]MBK1790646.1 murein biosynthesis integral membrane protein MurJ [Persicirhabdus sediminis]